jgi:hypothetical protein
VTGPRTESQTCAVMFVCCCSQVGFNTAAHQRGPQRLREARLRPTIASGAVVPQPAAPHPLCDGPVTARRTPQTRPPHLFGMPLCSTFAHRPAHSNGGWPCAVGPLTTSARSSRAMLAVVTFWRRGARGLGLCGLVRLRPTLRARPRPSSTPAQQTETTPTHVQPQSRRPALPLSRSSPSGWAQSPPPLAPGPPARRSTQTARPARAGPASSRCTA